MPAEIEMTHKVLKLSITFYMLLPHTAIDKSIHMHTTACSTSKDLASPVHQGHLPRNMGTIVGYLPQPIQLATEIKK